jgi:hypothetical protein
MAGLGPATHDFFDDPRKPWMPVTSTGMPRIF